MCAKHYKRWSLYGDPLVLERDGRSELAGHYVRVRVPLGHPLRTAQGWAYEHRVVLYDAGVEVPDGYEIHHLNLDKHDNRIENLAVLTPSEHRRLHAAFRRTG